MHNTEFLHLYGLEWKKTAVLYDARGSELSFGVSHRRGRNYYAGGPLGG